jgi:hypothetical protein
MPTAQSFLLKAKAEKFESIDGVIKVPTGAGMGVNIDPAYIGTHKIISS